MLTVTFTDCAPGAKKREASTENVTMAGVVPVLGEILSHAELTNGSFCTWYCRPGMSAVT